MLQVICIVFPPHYSLLTVYRVPQEEWSIFWEVIVSVILRKRVYMYISYSEQFPRLHCTLPKLLIRKRYYVLFLIPVFIVQVTKLVQFT
jgi:hypothetical protein